MPEKPLVFISCGQASPDEIALGKAIEGLIRAETPYDAYFAEQQNTLEGLVANILSALERAAALVAVMHHRALDLRLRVGLRIGTRHAGRGHELDGEQHLREEGRLVLVDLLELGENFLLPRLHGLDVALLGTRR